MIQINPSEILDVVRMNNKSVVFKLADGHQAFATKRVANEILSREIEHIFLEERTIPMCGTQLWLATPSRF